MSAVRLHSHSLGTPAAVGQELNRCLAVVRVATSRRGDPKGMPAAAAVIRSGRVLGAPLGPPAP